jgi:hypothetical protein
VRSQIDALVHSLDRAAGRADVVDGGEATGCHAAAERIAKAAEATTGEVLDKGGDSQANQ